MKSFRDKKHNRHIQHMYNIISNKKDFFQNNRKKLLV